jgi:hypothetical protein
MFAHGETGVLVHCALFFLGFAAGVPWLECLVDHRAAKPDNLCGTRQD